MVGASLLNAKTRAGAFKKTCLTLEISLSTFLNFLKHMKIVKAIV